MSLRNYIEACHAAAKEAADAENGMTPFQINTNCARCAHKHLTAAYALLTSGVPVWREVSYAEVLFARAVICLAEANDGYPGNRDVALGCLAAAETLSLPEDDQGDYAQYRAARLRVSGGDLSVSTLGKGLPPPGAAEFFRAHIAEAVRELPELRGKLHVPVLEVTLALPPYECDQLCEDLVSTITWLVDAYELKGAI